MTAVIRLYLHPDYYTRHVIRLYRVAHKGSHGLQDAVDSCFCRQTLFTRLVDGLCRLLEAKLLTCLVVSFDDTVLWISQRVFFSQWLLSVRSTTSCQSPCKCDTSCSDWSNERPGHRVYATPVGSTSECWPTPPHL